MSFSIEIDRLLATIYDSMRPDPSLREAGTRFGVLEPGVVFTLDLRLSHYGISTEEYHRNANAFVVLTGNTSVFVSVTDKHRRWYEMSFDSFENTSNHDSCWRTDGFRFLSTLFFKMSEEMGAEMQAQGHNAIAPKEYHQFCTLGQMVGPPFEAVMVDHARIPGEHHKRAISAMYRRD